MVIEISSLYCAAGRTESCPAQVPVV